MGDAADQVAALAVRLQEVIDVADGQFPHVLPGSASFNMSSAFRMAQLRAR